MTFERQFPHQANSFIVYSRNDLYLCAIKICKDLQLLKQSWFYIHVVGNFSVHDKLFIL